LEIWMTHNLSDSASTLLNEVLDAVRTNIQGWTADMEFSMEEIGNKYKVESIEDRVISAQILYLLKYFDQR